MNIVAHNILAMNAQRMYGINTNSKKKSAEKLSSGYRINRAADDAAGLSISEKMRKRIRGLNQGADNLKDGVSLCQTADGALMEVEDMIHRMNELAIKAANGTNSQSDREDINNEISELKDEMTRVFNTTKFNEIYIFKAPYTPDVSGEPTDYEMFNGSDGSTPAGVLINNKRYTFSELGVPASTSTDWIKEISDPDSPDELIRLRLKAGDSPEDLHRVYVMTADDTGIKINNLYAGLWDSTIREENDTLSFSYRGMDISIRTESNNRTEIIDRLNGDVLTEISWDAIPTTGDESRAVTSGADTMTFNVTNDNKNSIGSWAYQIQADDEGVALIQTSGDDGLTHTKTKWEDFTNTNGGDAFPISDWGAEDEGGNPITMDSSAVYRYTDEASAGYLTNGMAFSFRFLENEVAKAQAISGITQALTGSSVNAPVASITADAGVSVTTTSGFSSFALQRDKLLRDFGDSGSSVPMTLTVDRTMVTDGTVTDHEKRRELSEVYAKRIDDYTDTRTITYTGIASVKYYEDDGMTELTGTPADASYDGSVPASTTVTYNSGQNTSYVANTGISFDWTETANDTLSSASGTETVIRTMTYTDGEETKTGKVEITFNTTIEETRTTNSTYEKNGSNIKNYVGSGGSYTAVGNTTYYVMDSSEGNPKDTDGNTYRAATGADGTAQRYVQTGEAWIAVKTYDLNHYSYSGKNADSTQIISATGQQFLKTDGTATSMIIHTSTGAVESYKTENTASVLSATLSGSGASLGLNYTSGSGDRSNTVTVTPNGPATRTFTKAGKTGGDSSDTNLIVKVNPPTKKLELQATDVNLEREREILEWTPLSNSILGLSNANTKTIASARTTISSIEEALQTLNFDRSVFGAYQNRLEHAVKINDNTAENTQAAESIIRDTDMEKELVHHSIISIMMQAGEAMMTQANQSNQGVLSLIA